MKLGQILIDMGHSFGKKIKSAYFIPLPCYCNIWFDCAKMKLVHFQDNTSSILDAVLYIKTSSARSLCCCIRNTHQSLNCFFTHPTNFLSDTFLSWNKGGFMYKIHVTDIFSCEILQKGTHGSEPVVACLGRTFSGSFQP